MSIFAQSFKVYLGGNYAIYDTHKYRYEFTYNSISPISDTKAIQQTIRYEQLNKIEYNTYPGISVGINYEQKIGNRWRVVSGLGISTSKLEYDYTPSQGSSTLIKEDTIDYMEPEPNSFCDSFVTIGQFSNKTPIYHILQLEVPLLIRYEIVPGTWSIGLGGNLSTPLQIVHEYAGNDFSNYVNEANENVCVTEYKDKKDKSGNGFRDMNFGLMADLTYSFHRFGVSLSVEKRFHNVFYNSGSSLSSVSDNNFAKPTIVFFKVWYRL